MAHFAKLDSNNTVTEVLVIDNAVLLDDQGQENEQLGILFLESIFGAGNTWVQTSYNSNFRKKYAGIGDTYYANLDMFIELSPFDSWILNTQTGMWEAPVPYPTTGLQYDWSEETLAWIESQPLPEEEPPETS